MVKKITEQIPKRRRESRLLAAATALALSVLTVGDIPAVYAVDGDDEISFQTGTQTVSSSEEYNDDELLMGYLDSKLMEDMGISLYNYSSLADTSYLTADEKDLYNKLAADIKKVAEGQLSSAFFSYSYNWTASDLGVDTITSDNVNDAINAHFSYSLEKLHNCLLNDLPYELYWYDKSGGGISSAGSSLFSSSEVTYTITFSLAVGSAYRGTEGENSVDTSKTLAASTAAANVSTILSTYSSSSDYEKLVGYKNEICDLVAYNDEAASNGYSGDEVNPWQIIWVFDNDPETKVVCEGYSKAFKYLCDLTTFSDEIYCYTVTGNMNGGGHMWNILEIDRTPYHVDVTNCDEGTSGYPDKLFLKGVTSPSSSGFSIEGISYTYDSKSTGLYGSTYLAGLSTADYTPSAVKTVTGIAVKTEPGNKIYEIGDSFDLTGLVITVTYSDMSSEDVEYSDDNADDFSFSPASFDTAGTSQTVTVTYEGQTATISDITVNKKTPTASDFTFTAPSSTEYDGTAKEATVKAKSGVTGMGTFTVYYDDGENVPTTSVPEDAGIYTVKIDVAEGDTYSAKENITDSEWTFTITRAVLLDDDVKLSPTEFTYNGSEQKPTVTVKHGDNILTVNDYMVSTRSPNGGYKSAGAYTVKIEGKGNYSGEIEKTYEIKQAEPKLEGSVTILSPETVYNSTAVGDVELSGTFKGVGTQSSDTIGGTLEFADTVTKFTVGENQYDWVFTPSDSNYTTKTGKVTITVLEDTPASIEVTTKPTTTNYTIGEPFDPAGLVVTVKYASGATTPVEYNEDTKALFSFDTTTFNSAGTQNVTVTYAGKTADITGITVNKKTPTADDFTFTAPANLEYDGNGKGNL